MAIVLRALGASEIRVGRKVLTPAAEVVFGLGLYLCVRAGERLTREEVSELFWGGGREAQGRHSLRQMLYRLRQKGLTLDEDGAELYLDPGRVDSDLARALEEGWPTSASAAEVDAAAVFAPGFRGQVSPAYREWLDGVRAQLAAQHRRACLRQLVHARREGRWADLDRWALQVLRSDPLNEEATLARAESAAISGSKSVALEIIDAYMAELGDRAPAIGLPASVLRRRIAERRTEWSGRGPREVPLVGRAELMSRLTGYVDAAARGEGNSVLLWGAPGIGKTRLAEEVCAYAGVEGFRVVSVRSPSVGKNRPLGMILTVISALLDLPGAIGCSPDAHALLKRVTSGPRTPDASDVLATRSSVRELLAEAIADLLSAVSAEGRLVLLTDDTHNADETSVAVLDHSLHAVYGRRILHIGTSRRRPSSGVFGEIVLVPPLSNADTRVIAQGLRAGSRLRLDECSLSRIASAAGGNPLFARELSVHATAEDPFTLPGTLRELLFDRLSQLDNLSLRTLRLATLLGPQANAARLKRLLHPSGDLADILSPLEEQGLLRVGAHAGIELHECWQQAITESTGPAVRAALSEECASYLLAEGPRDITILWRAATLFRDAGNGPSALRCFIDCGEEMLMRGLPGDALQILREATHLAHTTENLLETLTLRAWSEHALGECEELITTCDRAIPLVRHSDGCDLKRYAALIMMSTDALAKTNRDFAGGLARLETLIANELLDPRTRQLLGMRLLMLAYHNADSPLVERVLSVSLEIRQEHGDSPEGCMTELMVSAERGDSEGVVGCDDRLEALDYLPRAIAARCQALRFRAMAMRMIGRLDRARTLGDQAFALSRQAAIHEEQLMTCDGMLHCALDRDDLSEAETWLSRLDSVPSAARFPWRIQALVHSRARFLAQSSRHVEALALFDSIRQMTTQDAMQRRRSVDEATIAYCAAVTGDSSRARQTIARIDASMKPDRASLQSDYYVEMLLRASSALGDEEAVLKRGRAYARARRNEFPTPVAPFYKTIQRFVNELRS